MTDRIDVTKVTEQDMTEAMTLLAESKEISARIAHLMRIDFKLLSRPAVLELRKSLKTAMQDLKRTRYKLSLVKKQLALLTGLGALDGTAVSKALEDKDVSSNIRPDKPD